MSNTNKVPSAEEILKERYFKLENSSQEDWDEASNQDFHKTILQAMHEHTRLHLEELRDEIIKTMTSYHETTGKFYDNEIVILEAANTYIKNNKL